MDLLRSLTPVTISIAIFATAFTLSCGNSTRTKDGAGGSGGIPAGRKPDQLRVLAVNYPLAYMAARIGGDAVEARYPGPIGADPAFWSPGPEDVALYQQADLVLLNGAGYARWINRVSLPLSRLVDTSRGFADRYIVECFRLKNRKDRLYDIRNAISHGEVDAENPEELIRIEARRMRLWMIVFGMFGRLVPFRAPSDRPS